MAEEVKQVQRSRVWVEEAVQTEGEGAGEHLHKATEVHMLREAGDRAGAVHQ